MEKMRLVEIKRLIPCDGGLRYGKYSYYTLIYDGETCRVIDRYCESNGDFLPFEIVRFLPFAVSDESYMARRYSDCEIIPKTKLPQKVLDFLNNKKGEKND